jgi:hypothetical protein
MVTGQAPTGEIDCDPDASPRADSFPTVGHPQQSVTT